MAEAFVPTEEELKKLPRWATVAFAARCARRVQPLFNDWDRENKYTRDITTAILVAEISAARASVFAADLNADSAIPFAGTLAAKNAANAAADVVCVAEQAVAYVATRVAQATVFAARAVIEAEAAIPAARAVMFAADTAATEATLNEAPCEILHRAIIRDYELLKEAARKKEWTDETPVSPEFFGSFWPEGEPEYWPVKEEEDDIVTVKPETDIEWRPESRIECLRRHCQMYLYASGHKSLDPTEASSRFFQFGLMHLVCTMFITTDSAKDTQGGVFYRILNEMGHSELLIGIDKILDFTVGNTTLRQYFRNKRNKMATHGPLDFGSQQKEVQDVSWDENSRTQFCSAMPALERAVAQLDAQLKLLEDEENA